MQFVLISGQQTPCNFCANQKTANSLHNFRNSIIVHYFIYYYFCRHDGDDFDSYSAVTAPYPPPPPEPRSEDDGYIQPSQEALQRLAGTASKRSKLEEESFNQIIDVKFDDIKPDEREWLTKALTEDDADKPGPKVITFFKGHFKNIQQSILHTKVWIS